jgi:hypothetical protein
MYIIIAVTAFILVTLKLTAIYTLTVPENKKNTNKEIFPEKFTVMEMCAIEHFMSLRNVISIS